MKTRSQFGSFFCSAILLCLIFALTGFARPVMGASQNPVQKHDSTTGSAMQSIRVQPAPAAEKHDSTLASMTISRTVGADSLAACEECVMESISVEPELQSMPSVQANPDACEDCTLGSTAVPELDEHSGDLHHQKIGDLPADLDALQQTDLIADRMFLRTGANTGSEVVNPVAGQRYYLHFAWRNSGSTAVTQRIEVRVNNNLYCGGTITSNPGEQVIWCTTPITWPAGSVTISGRLDVLNTVTETDENNNTASRTYGGGGGETDLIADRMFLRTGANTGSEVENPVAGQQYYLHFAWRNSGSTAVTQRIEVRVNNILHCGGTGTSNPGEQVIWCTTPITWPAGSVTISGQLDVLNTVTETNENNNTASRTYGGGQLPDLVAQRVYLRTGANSGEEVTAPVAGQSYFPHLDWRNAGAATTTSFRIEIRLNGNLLCAGTFTANAGDNRIVWCTNPIVWPEGNNTIEGIVDANGAVPESDEDNNAVSRTYGEGGGEETDLIADRMLLRTGANTGSEIENPVAGQQYYLHFAWRNSGSTAVTQRIELRVNNNVQCAGTITANPGEQVTWCTQPLTWPSGTVTVTGHLDVLDAVPETDEENNTVSRTYSGDSQLPDLVAQRVYLRTGANTGEEVSTPIAGQSYFPHLNWRNTGAATTTSFRVEIRLNGNLLCAGNFTANAGDNRIVWCTNPVVWPSGSNTIEGIVDANNAVPESDEDNNAVSRTYGVGAPAINVFPTSLTINQASGSQILRQGREELIVVATPQLDFGHPHVENELIIKFRPEVTITPSQGIDGLRTGLAALDHRLQEIGIANMIGLYPARPMPGYLKNTFKVQVSSPRQLRPVIDELAMLDHVEWVDLNYVFELQRMPNERQATAQPNDPMFPNQWYLSKVQAVEAWGIGTGSASVVIAIIDSGVDWDHPDLAGNIWINENEIPGNGIDDDNNGFIDDVRGWDFFDFVPTGWPPCAPAEDCSGADNDPMDFNGHGTHCAGIASAVTNNALGIAGMANGSKIMPLRVGYGTADGGGFVPSDFAASAVRYAVDNGAHVINMSFGAGNSTALLQAVTYAYNRNVVVTHAAGNQNSPQAGIIDGIAQTISVAATDQADRKANFSNFGSWIDVSAPGVAMRSTYFDNTYADRQGTSMAAPLVAGLAALLISQNPALTVDEVTNILQATADNIDAANPQFIGQLGAGRVNALAAMRMAVEGSGNLFTIENRGSAPLQVESITDDRPWLSTSGHPATPFEIAAGGRQTVLVEVNWGQVGSMQQTGTITVASNDTNNPSVPVDVTAVPSQGGGQSITVTSPAASDAWEVGSTQTVRWSSSGISVSANVAVKLSTDGGTTFPLTLVPSAVAGNGAAQVTVPDHVTSTARVRVELLSNPSVFGDNPGNFRIEAPAITLRPPRNLIAAPQDATIVLQWQRPSTATTGALLAAIDSAATRFDLPGTFSRLPAEAIPDASSPRLPAAISTTEIEEQEPNNTPDQAQLITGTSPLIVTGNAEVADQGALRINFSDGTSDDLEDLYRVTTTAAGLRIALDNFQSDCDLWLLDEAATSVIASSARFGPTTPEEIDEAELAAGTYIIGVTIFDPDPDGPPQTPYRLTVEGQFGGGAANLQAYRIYRAASSPVPVVAENRLGEVDATTTSFTDNTVSTDVTYYYVATARYSDGESGPSNEASARISTQTFAVSGRVQESGTGLAGVTMALSGDATAVRTTASDGTYRFTGLGDGTYTITPSLTGFTFTPNNRVSIVQGSDVSGQDFAASVSDTPLPPWQFVDNTGKNATIAVLSSAPSIGNEPLRSGDAIGVFFLRNDSLICGGFGVWESGQNLSIAAWGDNDQTGQKDGFTEGEVINYRIWQASSEREYAAVAGYQSGGPNYGTNSILIVNSLAAATSVEHRIALSQGWNMMSSNVQPRDANLDVLLAGIRADMVIMKAADGRVYWPDLGINQIGTWDALHGYQVFMRRASTLNVIGTQLDPASTSITLQQGWNLAAYLRAAPMAVETALASLGNSIVIVKNNAGQVYWPALGINTIGTMQPGQGYQINLSRNATLTYPANTAAALLAKGSQASSQSSAAPAHYEQALSRTGANATLVVEGAKLADGDEVAVWGAHGQVIGAGVVQDGRAVITVWGEPESAPAASGGAKGGDALALTVWSRSEEREGKLAMAAVFDGLTGASLGELAYRHDAAWIVEVMPAAEIPAEFSLAQNYPNPFNPATKITYGLPEAAAVTLEVYNTLGQRVSVLVDEHQDAGMHEVIFHNPGLPSGIYFYRLRAGSQVAMQKMIIVR